MIFEGMTVNPSKVIKIIPRIFLPYITLKARCLKRSMRTYAIIMDWIDIGRVHIVWKNILWTYIRFHLKNKISNITLIEVNIGINNALVEANFIILIDALKLDNSNLFNDLDDKINHLNWWWNTWTKFIIEKMRMYVCFIVKQHIKSSEINAFPRVWHCIKQKLIPYKVL